MWTPETAAAAGDAATGHKLMTKTWVRPGAEGDAIGEDVPGEGTAKVPCSFFAAGNCRYGDSCRFSHEGVGGDGAAATGEEEMAQDVEQ